MFVFRCCTRQVCFSFKCFQNLQCRSEASRAQRSHTAQSQHIYYTYMREASVCGWVGGEGGVCVQMLPESLVSVVSWMDKLSLNSLKHLSFIHPPFLIDLLLRWRNIHTHTRTNMRASTQTHQEPSSNYTFLLSSISRGKSHKAVSDGFIWQSTQ